MKISYPLTVKINLTKECNLRCKHCFLKNFKKSIDIDTFKNLVDDFVINNMKVVILTGGEIFILKDIFEKLNYLKEKNINISIASNGTLIDEEKAKKISRLNINHIQISLDGHNSNINDYIRGKNSFKNAVRGIKFLLNYNVNVVIGHVLNKKNYIYLDEFINFCINIGVKKVRFELYIPINYSKKKQDELALNKEDIKIIYIKLKEAISKYKNLKIIMPVFNSEFGCGAGIFHAIINPDLTVSPCDLYSEYYFSERISNNKTLKDIWNNSNVFKQWREIMEKCKKNNCKIGCRVSAKEYNGDICGVDPINMTNILEEDINVTNSCNNIFDK